MKYMEQVIWHDNLPVHLAHDEYWDLVENIRLKSDRLSIFTLNKDHQHVLKQVAPPSDEHLSQRALGRWKLYHRSEDNCRRHNDMVYASRDNRSGNQSEKNVF